MEFGFNIPTRGPLANVETMISMAQRGEELGYRWFAVPDHIVVPRAIDSRYPYSGTGAFPGSDSGECMEMWTVMAWLAAHTEHARLLSSVMVVPHRNAVHTAKIISTLDVLSGGRVVVGVGAGWMEEEFKAIGAPPFAARGRVTDEFIESWKELWTNENPKYQGEHVAFENITFAPRPLRKPHPPIWVGGESGPAMRRTVRLGDAWYPIGSNPRHPLNTVDRFKNGLSKLAELAQAEGRDPVSIEVTYWANWFEEGKSVTTDNGERHLFTGSNEDVAADIGTFRELGVTTLLFNFQRSSMQASLDAMQSFAENIAPLAGARMPT